MSHRTIPLNLATSGTIRIVDPNNTISIHSSQNTLRRGHSNNRPESNQEMLNRSQSNGNIIQCLDSNTICILDNANAIVRSEINGSSLRRNLNIVQSTPRTPGNSVIRNSISLPRNTEMLRQLEPKTEGRAFPPSETVSGARSSNPSTFHYEININSNNINTTEELFNSLRKNGSKSNYLKKRSNVFITGATSSDNGVASSALDKLTVSDIPPPLPDSMSELESNVIRSDAYYEDVFIGFPSSLNQDVNLPNMLHLKQEPSISTISHSTHHNKAHTPPPDDNEDYRPECENCKSGDYMDAEGEPPETMTLERVPKEVSEFENQEQYYKTSLTLPSHTRKYRNTPLQTVSSARENWFSSMPESRSSSEEE